MLWHCSLLALGIAFFRGMERSKSTCECMIAAISQFPPFRGILRVRSESKKMQFLCWDGMCVSDVVFISRGDPSRRNFKEQPTRTISFVYISTKTPEWTPNFHDFFVPTLVYFPPLQLLMFSDIKINSLPEGTERDSAKLNRASTKLKNEFFMFLSCCAPHNGHRRAGKRWKMHKECTIGRCSGDVMIFNKNSSLLPRKKKQQHKINKKTSKNSRTTKWDGREKAKRIKEILEDWKRFLRQSFYSFGALAITPKKSKEKKISSRVLLSGARRMKTHTFCLKTYFFIASREMPFGNIFRQRAWKRENDKN